VAIDLDDLVVIEDQTIGPEEESILELFFPQTYYVVGTEGNYLTTINNLDIYHRALELIGEDTDLDDPELREELAALLGEANELSQEEYDESVEREGRDSDDDYEEDEEDQDWDK
jgi:hypothetical protein